MRSVKIPSLLLLLVLLAGCGNIMDDLNPSGRSKVPPTQNGTTGPNVGQNAPDFTLFDTFGNTVTLSSVYPHASGVVLYFTMWCPICDSHLDDMENVVIPAFPQARFFAVDYVSGSVAAVQNAVSSNGFDGAPFSVLADSDKQVYNSFAANMGTTVVIDATGVIRMNEDYKDGTRLIATLQALP